MLRFGPKENCNQFILVLKFCVCNIHVLKSGPLKYTLDFVTFITNLNYLNFLIYKHV